MKPGTYFLPKTFATRKGFGFYYNGKGIIPYESDDLIFPSLVMKWWYPV